MSAYFDLIKRRPAFRTLWIGEMVSQLGDWLSYVAISLLAMAHGPGEGALALALVLAAHSLPHAVLAPITGPLADRFDRRSLLLSTHIGQAALTVAMLLSMHNLVALELLLVVRTSLSAVDWPVRTAAVAQVVDSDELLTANALSTATWSMTFAIGMGFGGALALLGPGPALALDSATFLLAAGLVSLLPPLPAPGHQNRSSVPLSTAVADRRILRAVLAKTPTAVAGGGGLVLLNLISAESAFVGAAGLTLGLLQTVKGVGTGFGPTWVRHRIDAGADHGTVWALSILGTFTGIAVFTASSGPMGWLAGSLIWGMGSGANWVLSTTELQRHAPPSHLGKLSALDALTMTLGLSVAAIVGGLLVEITGIGALAAWPALGTALLMFAGLWIATSTSANRSLSLARGA